MTGPGTLRPRARTASHRQSTWPLWSILVKSTRTVADRSHGACGRSAGFRAPAPRVGGADGNPARHRRRPRPRHPPRHAEALAGPRGALLAEGDAAGLLVHGMAGRPLRGRQARHRGAEAGAEAP